MKNDDNIRLVIFRLSALYGPFRSALDTLIRIHLLGIHARDFLQSPSFVGDVLVSRIHIIDACERIILSMTSGSVFPNNPCIVNLSDDFPCTRAECFHYALHLLDEPTIEAWKAVELIEEEKHLVASQQSPFLDIQRDKRPRTRISTFKKGKRILNQRMKILFGEHLHFLSYREGLLQLKNAIWIRYRSIFDT